MSFVYPADCYDSIRYDIVYNVDLVYNAGLLKNVYYYDSLFTTTITTLHNYVTY